MLDLSSVQPGMGFMKKFLFATLYSVVCIPWIGHTAPFLTADPYPTTVDQRAIPTEFVVTIVGMSPITTQAVPADANSVCLYLDLGPLNLLGEKTMTVRARNSEGDESKESLPLTAWFGPPGAPTNLRIVSP